MEDVYDLMVLPFVELEVRLGTIKKNGFDVSIDKKYFEKIMESLHQTSWNTIINKNTIEYIKSDKAGNTKLITDISNENESMMIKENILTHDFQLNFSPFDVRYSVNQEFNLNSHIKNFSKAECVVRNKTRKTFVADTFQYDLTIVNETIDGVLKTKHEIEIELRVTEETLTWKKCYINDFLECKIYDLVNIVEAIPREKFKLNLI
jgi:hypothetical protein